MAETGISHALLNAYRNNIIRYQKLLKTQLTELERNYVTERLSACQAAVEALIGREAATIWSSSSYPSEIRQRTMELR